MDCWQFPNYPETQKSETRDMNLLDLFILSHIRDGVLEADEDAAGDADDEDETEDDEGGNNN